MLLKVDFYDNNIIENFNDIANGELTTTKKNTVTSYIICNHKELIYQEENIVIRMDNMYQLTSNVKSTALNECELFLKHIIWVFSLAFHL